MLNGEGRLAGRHDAVQRVIVGDQVLAHHLVAVGGGVLGQIVVDQVDRAVAQRHITLLVHRGEVAQREYGIPVGAGQRDGAGRVRQAVLGEVLHIVDAEAGVDALEMGQEVGHFILIYRERRVGTVLPDAVGLGEGKALAVLRPGDRRQRVGVGGHDLLVNGGNAVDVLLHAGNDGDDRAQRDQHAHQDQQFFLAIHTFFLLRSTSSTPSSRKQTGTTPIIQIFSQVAEEELMVR